jgi:hypothetical protein
MSSTGADSRGSEDTSSHQNHRIAETISFSCHLNCHDLFVLVPIRPPGREDEFERHEIITGGSMIMPRNEVEANTM